MSIDSNGRSHSPAGVPTGGRFQPETKREADNSVTLTQLRSQAGEQYRVAQRMIELTTARLIAEDILTECPDARYIELEQSDQGEYFWAGRILNDDNEHIEDGDSFDVVNDYLPDIPLYAPSHIIQTENGVESVQDPDYDWITLKEGYNGVEGLIDLRKAAAIKIDGVSPAPSAVTGTFLEGNESDLTGATRRTAHQVIAHLDGTEPNVTVHGDSVSFVFNREAETIRVTIDQDSGRVAGFGSADDPLGDWDENISEHPVLDKLRADGLCG